MSPLKTPNQHARLDARVGQNSRNGGLCRIDKNDIVKELISVRRTIQ